MYNGTHKSDAPLRLRCLKPSVILLFAQPLVQLTVLDCWLFGGNPPRTGGFVISDMGSVLLTHHALRKYFTISVALGVSLPHPQAANMDTDLISDKTYRNIPQGLETTRLAVNYLPNFRANGNCKYLSHPFGALEDLMIRRLMRCCGGPLGPISI